MSKKAASAYRHEQEMLADAQRQGVQLSTQQRAQIHELATGMASAEQATTAYAQSQQQAAQMMQQFGDWGASALEGILTGTKSAKQALAELGQMMLRFALQNLFKGFGQSGGGFGSLFGGLFGFAEGGLVRGPGTATSDSILAALSNEEFVVNAKASKKHRALLEAINSGQISLPTGGLASRFLFNNSFAPNTTINVNGSRGHPHDLARTIASEVGRQMNRGRDTFRRSQRQTMAENYMHAARASARNN